MFEQASRLALRFTTNKGQISVEDLWNLPLEGITSLNSIAKSLNKEIKQGEEESFVSARPKSSEVLALKFDLVKHIIKVRLAEDVERTNAADNSAYNQKILNLIKEKEEEGLKNLSSEDLQKLLR